MTYKEWMIGKYIHMNNPEGDVARDIEKMGDFPNTVRKKKIIDFIATQNLDYRVPAIIDDTWRDFILALVKERECNRMKSAPDAHR